MNKGKKTEAEIRVTSEDNAFALRLFSAIRGIDESIMPLNHGSSFYGKK